MGFRKFNGHLTEIEYPIPGIDTAINVLCPGGRWEVANHSIVAWEHDDGLEPPTSEEIQEELKREVELYNYYLYERNREKEFPALKDQLDMLYHDIKNGNVETGSWIQAIDSVKEKYPKPD